MCGHLSLMSYFGGLIRFKQLIAVLVKSEGFERDNNWRKYHAREHVDPNCAGGSRLTVASFRRPGSTMRRGSMEIDHYNVEKLGRLNWMPISLKLVFGRLCAELFLDSFIAFGRGQCRRVRLRLLGFCHWFEQ